MAIPIGLLPMSAGQITPGLLNGPQQGYWVGNQFVFPRFEYTPPQHALPTETTPAPAAAIAGDTARIPPDPGAMTGAGAQGEMGGFGDRAPAPSPAAAPAAPGIAGLSPIDPRDLPSLPGMPAPNPPSAPMSPAVGLAPAPETDQTGKPAPQVGQVAPSVPGLPAEQTPTVSEMKEMADKAKADLAAIGKEVFGTPGVAIGDEQDAGMTAEAQAAAQAVDTSDASGRTPAENGPGPGAGTGTGVSTDQNSDEGGVGYRKGGRVASNKDGHLQPVPGLLHEGEFVMNPEMTAMMDKHAPGLLSRIAKMQKKMVGRMGMLG